MQASAGVRDVMLLDYLYRLRMKTNYVDSDMFTDGPEDGSDSWQLRSDVGVITADTLLVHEFRIGSHVGFPLLVRWAEEWVDRSLPRGASSGLAGRLPELRLTAFRRGYAAEHPGPRPATCGGLPFGNAFHVREPFRTLCVIASSIPNARGLQDRRAKHCNAGAGIGLG